MSRTKRKKRPQMNLGSLADRQHKDGTVRDGTPTHNDGSCAHHGGCPWCEGNRTIDRKRIESREYAALSAFLSAWRRQRDVRPGNAVGNAPSAQS